MIYEIDILKHAKSVTKHAKMHCTFGHDWGGGAYGFESNVKMVLDSGCSQSPKMSVIIFEQFLSY